MNSILVIATLLGVTAGVLGNLQCRSYGKQVGECVNIARCPPLLAIILSKEKTSDDIRMLQKLTCITESVPNRDPVVCCPKSEIVSESYLANPQDYFGSSPTPPPRATTSRPSSQGAFPTRRRGPIIVTPVASASPSTMHKISRHPHQSNTNHPSAGSPEEEQFLRRRFLENIPPLANCSRSDVGRRIIGGNNADHGEYPFMARLGYRNLKSGKVDYYCGGVIISKRYILTAAHCTYEYDENFLLVHVRLGEHNAKELTDCSQDLGSCSVPENIDVEKVITHAQYNTNTKHNDIALVRLAKDIGFQTYFIKPVCLPFFKEYGIPEPKSIDSKMGIVTGWGRTNWTRSEGSSILQYVHLPIVSRDKCIRDFKNRINITFEQLCAGGERNQDSCSGDSGGPLMIDTTIGETRGIPKKKRFQYGIVSFGPVKCGIGIPGVYTRVTEYLSWILMNVEP